MKWLALDASKTLCFGTGRGLILIYGGSKFEARTLEVSIFLTYPDGEGDSHHNLSN